MPDNALNSSALSSLLDAGVLGLMVCIMSNVSYQTYCFLLSL